MRCFIRRKFTLINIAPKRSDSRLCSTCVSVGGGCVFVCVRASGKHWSDDGYVVRVR